MPIITVSSFKGGTAKTSNILHIASALALFHKKKVLLLDFDAQANLSTGLGFDPDEQDSLAPVLKGDKNIQDVILETCIPGLSLIPADSWLERIEVTDPLASDRYSHERLKFILSELDYDYILIDTPPSLSWLTESALIASDYTLVCATPEFYSIKGLERLSAFIQTVNYRHPIDVIGVCITFWNPRGKSNLAFEQVIERTFPDKLLKTRIRRDITVSEATIYGKPVFKTAPKSRATEDFKILTKELLTKIKNHKVETILV